MAIKQIQLRGISRTPSDRLTNDGGCAESLNVQLDNTELAPSFYPDDVTTRRGLPADLEAEKIFIHKTANYENYIVVLEDKVISYTPNVEDNEPLTVLELSKGEKVSDIVSVGNTLVFSTSSALYYILYKNREYVFLGNKVPFPYIDFDVEYASDLDETEMINRVGLGAIGDDYTWPDNEAYLNENTSVWFANALPSEEDWNENPDKNIGLSRFSRDIKNKLNEISTAQRKDNYLTTPVFIRYSVDLYGANTSSPPILLAPALPIFQNHINVECISKLVDGSNGLVFFTVDNKAYIPKIKRYKIKYKIVDALNLEDWKDVISNIKIYISSPIALGDMFDYTTLSERTYLEERDVNMGTNNYIPARQTSTGKALPKRRDTFKDDLLFSSADTYLVKKIAVFNEEVTDFSDDFKALEQGAILDVPPEFVRGERLQDDDMKHYMLTSTKLDVFNNKLLLLQASQTLDYDYNRLNAYDIVKRNRPGGRTTTIEYDVTYLLRGYDRDKVVKKKFTYLYSTFSTERIYAFQIFPDSRCFKMIIKATKKISGDGSTSISYGEFIMLQHPYLDCSYYYGGLENELINLCTLDSGNEYAAYTKDVMENKLVSSELDKPFFFPTDERYTFQSKILGVAIATTALSQGQFGQFPLYVFTEDGIWAMETGADGSFVSQKPLSCEVCINPDSITSLDNAVVFVTAQGVMLLQGSRVTNISPFMNGRHYDVEESAKNIINGQKDFKDFIPVIDDETHFMAFMREAKIAYDYAGKRLVFIKEGEAYQYIYKLDTQTWHKSAYGMNLVAPINSYPECLVMGKGEGTEKIFLKITSIAESQLNEYQLSEDFMLYFGDSYGLTEEQLIEVFTGLEMLNITEWSDDHLAQMKGCLETERVYYEIVPKSYIATKVLDLSTILDAAELKTPTKGVIATRPLDLGEPDVFKTITDIRVRGQYPKGAVKFILLGSNDGVTFYTINTLRGKAWKLFRIIILADLQPTDRISWIDVQYETKFTNKLR